MRTAASSREIPPQPEVQPVRAGPGQTHSPAPALAARAAALLFATGAAEQVLILFDGGRPHLFQWVHFVLGIGYEVMSACVLAMLIYALALASPRAGRIAALVLLAALAIFNFIDFQYYLEFHTHLPFSTVEYVGQAGSFTSTIGTVLLSRAFAGLVLLPVAIGALVLWARSAERSWRPRTHSLALGSYLVLGLAGNTFSNSYVGKNLANPLEFTALQHFVFTYADVNSPAVRMTADVLQRLNPRDAGYPLLRAQSFGGCLRPGAPFRELCAALRGMQRPPNIVFVMLESFRAQELGALGGAPGLSPRFDGLAQEGLLFTRFYGNGFQTRDGLIASYCSLYPSWGAPILGRYDRVRQDCLPELLRQRGYATAWVHGGDAGFDRMRGFLLRNGFDKVVDRWDFTLGTERLGWGLADEALMEKSVQEMSGLREPFFMGIVSMTNHHPFEAPERFQTHHGAGEYSKFLDTMAYTDYALGRLFDLASAHEFFKHTVFFIYADHSVTQPAAGSVGTLQQDLDWRHRIPLLVVAPGLTHGQRVDTPYSQADLPPLTMDLLGAAPMLLPWVGRSPVSGADEPVLLVRPGDYAALLLPHGAALRQQGHWRSEGQVPQPAQRWADDMLLAGQWVLQVDRVVP